MAAPDNSYIFCAPLQEQFWDKDLNVPLAAGVVTFYKNSSRTVLKDVYIYDSTQTPPFVNVGSSLTLSSIGTFINPNDGKNAAIFLWPFIGHNGSTNPSTATLPLDPDPYYIKVVSSTSEPQFTVENWPPNVVYSVSSSSAFSSILVTRFPSGSTVWSPQANTAYAMFECIGGGGGGGGVGANPGGQKCGGGGGAGGYSRITLARSLIIPSQTVTVGALGAGGAAGSNPGTAGTASSVGSLCIANGGQGGGITGGLPQSGGVGAIAGTGDITGTGESGKCGVGEVAATFNIGSGDGGNTQWGAGGLGKLSNATSNGNAATGPGGGGSGGVSVSASSAAGGNGFAGLVIITEYLT